MNNISNISDYLNNNSTLTYAFKGTSMYPILKEGRDLFTVVSKTSDRCKKYDVVLFRKSEKQYVLHRIIKICEDTYVTMGDNSINKEYGIRDEDIVGVMVSFNHNGKNYKVSDIRYIIYVHIWTKIHPIINFFKLIKSKISNIIKGIFDGKKS